MIDEQATRYPLSWPTGWKRTPRNARRRASFRSYGGALTVARATARLSDELRRLGARDEILSTNVRLRLDGLPYSGEKEPDDVGAAVYFTLSKQARCLACDKWDRTADNIAAVAQHIDALRRMDRYGVGTLDQAFAGFAPRLQAAAFEWWIVLDLPRHTSIDSVKARFTALAREAHPDAGGTHAQMARLTEARDAALHELGGR